MIESEPNLLLQQVTNPAMSERLRIMFERRIQKPQRMEDRIYRLEIWNQRNQAKRRTKKQSSFFFLRLVANEHHLSFIEEKIKEAILHAILIFDIYEYYINIGKAYKLTMQNRNHGVGKVAETFWTMTGLTVVTTKR